MTLTEIPTEELRAELNRRLARKPDPIVSRALQLITAAATCYGLDTAQAYKSQLPLAVRARWATWMQLGLDGHSANQTAKIFKRDKGAVTNALRQCAKITQTDGRFAACLALLGTLSPPAPKH